MTNKKRVRQVAPWLGMIGLLTLSPLVGLPARGLAQAEDLPPAISNATVTPSSLPTEGGTVTITVDVTDDVGVSAVHADLYGPGPGLSVTLSLTTGNTYSGTVMVPANQENSPASYQVSITALDTVDGTTTATIITGITAKESFVTLRHLTATNIVGTVRTGTLFG